MSIYDRIRPDMKEALRDYGMNGRPLGGFLSSVVSNEFVHAALRADDDNRRTLYEIAVFVWHELPAPCWGSRRTYERWINRGGLHGHKTQTEARADQ